MKAVMKFTRGKGETRLVDIPEPTPGREQVKIKVIRAGICGSDVHVYRTDMGKHRIIPPVVLGHEGTGVIVEVGPDVEGLKPGDRVISETTYYVCGTCRYCIEGDYNLCPNRKGLGTKANGFFAEYVIANSKSVHVLPDSVDFESAALVEPLACAVHIVLDPPVVKPGDSVVVFGPGTIGLLVTEVARTAGGRVILCGTNHSRHRLDLGKKLGASEVLTVVDSGDVSEKIKKLTDGAGCDVAIECSGSESAIHMALDCLRKRGKFILGASPAHRIIELNWSQIFYKELWVRGSLSQRPSAWRRSLELLERKAVQTKPLVTHTFSLTDWEEGYRVVEQRSGVKVLLDPWMES